MAPTVRSVTRVRVDGITAPGARRRSIGTRADGDEISRNTTTNSASKPAAIPATNTTSVIVDPEWPGRP
jgi:hypothetical protein